MNKITCWFVTFKLILSFLFIPVQVRSAPHCSGVVYGTMILIVGAVLFLGLKKMCKNISPPATPPPPPPAPGNTNQTAMTMSSSSIAIPLGTVGDTNQSAFAEYDIRGYGWYDPRGYLYEVFSQGALLSSTNSIDWTTNMVVRSYSSVGSLLMVWCNGEGYPVSTNYAESFTGEVEISCPVELINLSESKRFFKLVPLLQ